MPDGNPDSYYTSEPTSAAMPDWTGGAVTGGGVDGDPWVITFTHVPMPTAASGASQSLHDTSATATITLGPGLAESTNPGGVRVFVTETFGGELFGEGGVTVA